MRALRIARGIGVNQLGNAIDLEPSNLSRFERGLPGGVHTAKYLDQIASKLGTSASILYVVSEITAAKPDILQEPAELVKLVAEEIADAPDKTAFEKQFSDISRPASQPASATRSNPPTSLAASRFPLEVLERAEKRLAEYIGAVARVVVKRAAMKARDEAELYLLLADEIENKEDRKAFARKAVSMSRKP